MTRKDYVLIAEAIRNAANAVRETSPEYMPGLRLAARYLAADLASTNPRFDRERFIADCGAEG